MLKPTYVLPRYVAALYADQRFMTQPIQKNHRHAAITTCKAAVNNLP